jgi:hypothetical protein
MPRITFEWTGGHFSTDCSQMAEMFVQSPENFQPSMRGRISAGVQTALRSLLGEAGRADPRYNQTFSQVTDGISVKVQHLKTWLR